MFLFMLLNYTPFFVSNISGGGHDLLNILGKGALIHSIKAYGSRGTVPLVLNLGSGKWSASRSCHFTLEERAVGTC
jgi:hypothetical protein